MDWIHCNNCFFLPGMGKRIFLTSCGHIYCADGIKECAAEHCKLCGNPCSSIPLTSQMKPDVEMFFSDPLELLKKYLKEIQKVAEFQNSHRARLFAHQREKAKKTHLLKDELTKIQLKFKECEGEKQKLKNQVDCMKQMLNINHTEIPTPPMSDTDDRTPQYLPKGDEYRDTTTLSKWSHDYPRASSSYVSLSNNLRSSCSDGNTASGSRGNPIHQITLPRSLKQHGSIKTLAVSLYHPNVEKAKRP